jgi:hypothetical protein
MVMTEAPEDEAEVMRVRPGICPNWRSSGEVTVSAITSGLAPG